MRTAEVIASIVITLATASAITTYLPHSSTLPAEGAHEVLVERVMTTIPINPLPTPVAFLSPEALALTGHPGEVTGRELVTDSPYILYLSNSSLHLMRAGEGGSLKVIASSRLPHPVKKDTVVLSEYLAAEGGVAAVAATYVAVKATQSIPPSCGGSETVEYRVGDDVVKVTMPVCRFSPDDVWTVITLFRYGPEGLEEVGERWASGAIVSGEVIVNGRVYAVLRSPLMSGAAGELGGSPLTDLGPTYSVGTSEWTGYLSVLSIDPATLGVQVMNLVVPAQSLTHEPVLINDLGSLFILLRSGQEVTDYEIASALLRCSSAAPPGLREALEELPPNASPREVLQAIKDWRRGAEREDPPTH